MSVPIVSLFNCKGGVGKTTLTAHVAIMLGELGYRVVVADLDPQYNLSAMLLTESQLDQGWKYERTVFDALAPYHNDGSDILPPHLWPIRDDVALLSTDFRQSDFEERYAAGWSLAQHDNEEALKQLLGFRFVLEMAAEAHAADVVLVDLAPQFSAMNRAVLVNCTHLAVPLTPNALTLRTLQLLGATLGRWQSEWHEINETPCCAKYGVPIQDTLPIGYIVGHIHQRGRTTTAALQASMQQIPELYHRNILNQELSHRTPLGEDDACLAIIRNFHSLIQLADDAKKPVFDLKPADGAIGAHGGYVQEAYKDFEKLSKKIASRIGLST
ncbi:ParA family protein [Rhodopirellula sp. P2]|uniref:ParA family protein n=1 Tax=Rhodopirellula sp. P2 TaxID=2127060 RepID=UPI002367CF73|nr:ParA family protein [Rhodopirellula sp. P2]WDQ14573.1 ParA family protein [Rhodopirellula sp. P2]